MKLRRPVKSSLGRGDRTTFVLRERPVGVLRYVQLYNDGGKPGAADADWFVSYIVLSTPYNNHCYTLPCYRWLAGRSLLSLRDGTGEKTCLSVLRDYGRHTYHRLTNRLLDSGSLERLD